MLPKSLNRTKSWGITTKLILTITILSLILLTCLSILVNEASTRELTQQINQRLVTRAELEGLHTGNLLAKQVDLVRAVVSSDPEILNLIDEHNSSYSGSEDEIETQLLLLDNEWREVTGKNETSTLIENILNDPVSEQLRLFIQQFPAHAETFITDKYGATIAMSNLTSDYYQADEAWWQNGWNNGEGTVFLSAPEFDESANIVAIDLAVPIYAPETNELIAIVKTVYDINALITDISEFKMGQSGQANIIDNERRFVVGSTPSDIGKDIPQSLSLDGQVFTGSGFNLDLADNNGKPIVMGYAPVTTSYGVSDINSIGWVVQVLQDHNEAFAPTRQLQSVATGYTVLAVILAAIFAFWISRTTTRNLLKLTTVAESFGQGQLNTRADINSFDEIGILGGAFNEMANKIQQRETDMRTINESLEKRVAERTIDLKKARDDALAAQRIANENSRLKSEFLSMMSHELRTPMNAIEGFTSIMLNRMAGTEYNAKSERYLGKIQANSKRLLGLINDFLDLSRIESGRLELAYLPMSPIEMAQSWKDNLSSLAEKKNLDFEVSVDPSLPTTLYGDEESLSKIAINLLGNAIKFTEEGHVTLKLEKHDNSMLMIVEDTGMGIPPHARDYIFDEFRQVDMSSKRQYGGTGLGLSIVQKLAIAMGGSITLQSEVGSGSIFTVTVPIETEALAV